MFFRLGLLVARRARLVLGLAAVVLVASAVFGLGVFGRLLTGGFDDPASASSRASTLLDQKFGGEPDIVFLVHARSGTVDQPAVVASGQALATRLGHDDRLRNVTSYWTTRAPSLRSEDRADALILAHVAGDDRDADSNAKKVLSDYAHLDDAAATVRIGGAHGTDVGSQVGKDLGLAESIAVPITLVLLVLAFGSLVAALLPLLVGVVAIFATLAELTLLTHVTSVSVFAINLTTALGLGLGIDYALLMVSRFREQLGGGGDAPADVPADVPTAVAQTMATAGRTIAFSALAVSAALAAMLVFPVYFLRSFAYAGVAVTIFSALAALLVLPAVLALLGPRVNAGRIRGLNPARSLDAPFWSRLARGVMRRPARSALPVVAVLLFLATPLLSVTFGTPDDRVLPTSAASHQVGDALRTGFATQPTAIDVLITPGLPAPALREYAARLSRIPGVQRADSGAGAFAHGQPTATPGANPAALAAGGTQRLTLSTADDAMSGTAQDLVRAVRAQPVPPGAEVLVGGATAELVDGKHAIGGRLALAGALIAITTFVLLFLFTGSVVQPVRALLGNALTLGATLGAMVWIFQGGHLASIFGFTPTPTNTAMPVLLFCIAFGLSMDYEMFVMSRVTEARGAGASTAEAVAHGLSRSGRLVSTLAALLAVSFFAFTVSKVSFIQFFGLGTGLAILIDATLVRGVLLPASLRALGERSWYAPRYLRRLHQRIGLTDAEPAPAAGLPGPGSRPAVVSGAPD